MVSNQPLQELLPWANRELQLILEDLISHGTELAKIDFKRDLDIATTEQKSELLKDLIAIANTYDENYQDYGFLVYGVQGTTIVGVQGSAGDTDKLQNQIEQLLKTYIAPMLTIYALGFTSADGTSWGAIVIPPRDNKPHMFFRDLESRDPKQFRRRGEWFVRRGATTERGGPEDLMLIVHRQTAALLEPLHESIRNLQSRASIAEERYNTALFKLVAQSANVAAGGMSALEADAPGAVQVSAADLPARLRYALRRPIDALGDELVSEARALHEYLAGSQSGLAWLPQANDSDDSRRIVESIEAAATPLQVSIATAILNDRDNVLSEKIVRSIAMVARAPEAPIGTSFNRIGEALRYYPLGLLLYTSFVCGVAANRGDLLQRILSIPLKFSRSRTTSQITDVFSCWYDARELFNSAIGVRKCEPMVERARQTLADRVGEMVPTATEAEYFFAGEFALALTGIDRAIVSELPDEMQTPLPGLYLYSHEASDVIAGFLGERSDWLESFYASPLMQILQSFERNAGRATARDCWGRAMIGFKPTAIYEEALARRARESKRSSGK